MRKKTNEKESVALAVYFAGAVIAAISLTNYAIGMKHEKARLTYVQKRCIEEIKACFVKETAIYGKQPKIEA